MTLALMALAAAPSLVTLVDEPVRIPAGQWRTLPIVLRQQPGVVQAAFRVRRGDGVRVLLVTRKDADLWRAGQPFTVVGQSAVTREATVNFPARKPGDYELVVDYSSAKEGLTELDLKVGLAFGNTNSMTVRYLEPQRRLFVIWASLCFFGATVWFAGLRLARAIASRE
ncbi:MAG: hypothetical protein SFV54_15080 [Bryobacteraceae bacterium]|nr:hypothetical protein [Bryobacteraceae bacterium]